MANKEAEIVTLPAIDEEDKSKDEVRVIFNLMDRYPWATKHSMEDMITLSNDIGELSIYAAGEALFKSHIYSGLGAALYEGKSLILWIDYPLEIIKKYCRKTETSRVYWNEGTKARSYSCLAYEDDLFGLSPSCQEFKILNDDCLKEYGLKLKTSKFDFMGNDWDEPIRYLELDVKAINTEPTKSKLMKYLGMGEEDIKTEKIIQDLRKRKEEKQKMNE
jgi:hypothetical protein